MIYWYWWSIVKDKQQTSSAGSVDLLHILHGQSTEQYNTESSCIDLNNSVVVKSVSEFTQKWKPTAWDLYLYHVWEYLWCEYEYWAVEYEYEYIASEYKYLKFVEEWRT